MFPARACATRVRDASRRDDLLLLEWLCWQHLCPSLSHISFPISMILSESYFFLLSTSPSLHFLFILCLFARCFCFLPGQTVGCGLQRGTVLPGKVEMLLPSGCQAWPSSRGAVLQKQKLGAGWGGMESRRTGLSHMELPQETRLFSAGSGHGPRQRCTAGREAGGAHTGMLPPCPGQRKKPHCSMLEPRAAGPHTPLRRRVGCAGMAAGCRGALGTSWGASAGGVGPVPPGRDRVLCRGPDPCLPNTRAPGRRSDPGSPSRPLFALGGPGQPLQCPGGAPAPAAAPEGPTFHHAAEEARPPRHTRAGAALPVLGRAEGCGGGTEGCAEGQKDVRRDARTEGRAEGRAE